jgi:hypothetical protein
MQQLAHLGDERFTVRVAAQTVQQLLQAPNAAGQAPRVARR